MKGYTLTFIIILLLIFLLIPFSGWGEGDLTKQKPIELTAMLGNKNGELRFFPHTLSLQTGKLYRLILSNPSSVKHYFSSDGMSRAVYTRKVQVNGKNGKPIAEIKGSIREIEVYPQGTAEWWFVPVKAGTFNDLKCTIAGHAEAGMVGTVTIR
jgi:uncharacterized cupredoxin-like copper-binding protein